VFLGLGLHAISIERKGESVARLTHGGKSTTALRIRDAAFYLRSATMAYAGAEAVRRVCGPGSRWRAGAEDDLWQAYHALEAITCDLPSLHAAQNYAMRRARVLVDHYWPEIEALASVLLERKNMTGKEASKLIHECLRARRGTPLQW
jgi:hypothetical protein